MDDDVKEFLDVGADLVVAKPMKMQKLVGILDCFSSAGDDDMLARQELRALA